METKNSEQYISLDIYLKVYFLDKKEVNYSESRYYMGISGKGLSTSMNLRSKNPNNKQKESTDIIDINNQYFRKFLKRLKNHLI